MMSGIKVAKHPGKRVWCRQRYHASALALAHTAHTPKTEPGNRRSCCVRCNRVRESGATSQTAIAVFAAIPTGQTDRQKGKVSIALAHVK